MKSIFWTPRRANLFFTVALSFGEVDLLDLEACEFIFYSAVSLLMGALMRWSRCCGPRGSLAWQCSLSSGVDLVDPEAQIYFLQWSPFDIRTLGFMLLLACITLKLFRLSRKPAPSVNGGTWGFLSSFCVFFCHSVGFSSTLHFGKG